MKCDEIFAALAMLEKERGISQTFMMDKIVQALTTAYKRDHEGVEYVVVDVDEEKKDLKMYVQKVKQGNANMIEALEASIRDEKAKIGEGKKTQNMLRRQIDAAKNMIAGLETDIQTLAAHPHPEDGFAGMEVKGDLLTDKDNAGAAILEAFKDAKGMEPVPIGSYRGFAMSLTVENFGKDFILTLKGKMSHRVELGKDARGNLVRIDNALAQMPERHKTVQGRLENVQAQLATAKAELGKPFPQEAELAEKMKRLDELNILLNMDKRDNEIADECPDEGEKDAPVERSDRER